MAITLAEYQILIDSNTKSLDATVKAIRGMDKTMSNAAKKIDAAVNKMNRAYQNTAKAAKGAASAQKNFNNTVNGLPLRQFRELESAKRRFNDMTQAIQRSGISTEQSQKLLKDLTAAYGRHMHALQRGEMTTNQFAKSQERFRNAASSARRQTATLTATLKKQQAATNEASVAFQKFQGSFDRFGRAIRVIEGPLGGTAARFQTLGAALKVIPLPMLAVVGAITSTIFAFAKLVPELIRVQLEFGKIRGALDFATGSTALAKKEFDFLSNTSLKLGLDLTKVSKQFVLLSAATKGTALEGEFVRKLFTSVAKASVVLGLSADDTAGIFRAFQQMISKGNVQAEELRGQLGERLPGAFRLASEAMGVTTQELNKMLKDGKVLAVDLLPKLIDKMEKLFDPKVESASKRLRASIDRLKTSWDLFLDALNTRLPVIDGTAKAVNSLILVLLRLKSALKIKEKGTGLEGDIQGVKDKLSTLRVELKALEDQKSVGAPLLARIFGSDFVKNIDQKIADASFQIRALEVILDSLGNKLKETDALFDEYQGGVGSITKKLRSDLKSTLALVDKAFASDVPAEKALRNLKKVTEESKKAVALVLATGDRTDLAEVEEKNAARIKVALKTYLDAAAKAPAAQKKEIDKLVKNSEKAFDSLSRVIRATENQIKSLENKIKPTKREIFVEEQVRVAQARFDALKDGVRPPLQEIEGYLERVRIKAGETFDFTKEQKSLKKFAAMIKRTLVSTQSAKESAESSVGALLGGLRNRATPSAREQFISGKEDAATKIMEGRITATKEVKRVLNEVRVEAAKAFDWKEMRKLVDESQTPLEKFNERMATLQRLMVQFPEHSDVIGKAMSQARKELIATDPVLKKLGEAFDDLASGIVDAMFTSGDAMEGLRNKAQKVAQDILETFLQLAVIDPIKKALFGSLSGFLTGGFGGGGNISSNVMASSGSGGSLFTSVNLAGNSGFSPSFAKGGAFNKGTRFLSQGGLLNGPTAFSSSEGLSIGGEAGTEAVMPLGRTPGGDLGVKTIGSQGGRTVVIVQNITVQAGVSQTVRAEMMGLLPAFKKAAKDGVVEDRRRQPNMFSSGSA